MRNSFGILRLQIRRVGYLEELLIGFDIPLGRFRESAEIAGSEDQPGVSVRTWG